MNNQIDSNNLDKRILILEKFYHIAVGRRTESKPVRLTKQNYSSPANLKYKQPRVLITGNNNVYKAIRKKTFAVF